MAIYEPVLIAKEKGPYSADRGPLTRKIRGDVDIPMAAKGSTARAYCPLKVAVLFGLFPLAAYNGDIVDGSLLLSQRTESAINYRVRTMIKQSEMQRRRN